MGTLYEDDIIAWSEQQAALLRAGRWELLDHQSIAEEIEDVGNREKQALRSRMVVLLVHLLKWKFQTPRRRASWVRTIRTQRVAIADALDDYPSLQTLLDDPQWLHQVYRRGRLEAEMQMHLQNLSEEMPWNAEQLLSQNFYPE